MLRGSNGEHGLFVGKQRGCVVLAKAVAPQPPQRFDARHQVAAGRLAFRQGAAAFAVRDIAIEEIDGFTLGRSAQPGVDCAFDALANAIDGLLAGGDEEVLEEAAQRRADQQVSVSIDCERAIDVGIA